jgi:hypothetical protein
MTKITDREQLTEMMTIVVTPSMRARIQRLADDQAEGKYSVIARRGFQKLLDAEAPVTPEEAARLGAEWTANKGSTEGEN